MLKKFLRLIYYLIYDLLKILKNFDQKNNFIILLPRCFGSLFNKILIYDKLNNNFFFQYVRNKYDVLTVFEIFNEESYSLTKLKSWNKININYKKILKNNLNPLIIDCGSNIGCSSEYFSRIFSKASILSLEPNNESLTFSKKNLISSRVTSINKAVSSEDKKLLIDIDDHDNRNSKISSVKGIEIQSVSIKNLINDNNESIPFIIKIDIEGFENELFSKNYDWINKFDIIIIEIHDWMLPGEANSFNFFNALVENMNTDNKRDLIISGENLISIKTNE